jgi:hypothetical protein
MPIRIWSGGSSTIFWKLFIRGDIIIAAGVEEMSVPNSGKLRNGNTYFISKAGDISLI